jgi:hypothetical protein
MFTDEDIDEVIRLLEMREKDFENILAR